MWRFAGGVFTGMCLGFYAPWRQIPSSRTPTARINDNDGACMDSDDSGLVHCYNSIEDSVHIKGMGHTRKVFSSKFQPYQLGEVIPITHDVALFRFLMHDMNDEFNLKPCSTLQACNKFGVQAAEQTVRFYTPVTANHTKGYFDIIVKRKKGGSMTSHLFGMHIGDKLLFRAVTFKIQYKPNRWKKIGMIAGGTGFTPMLQVIRHSLTEPLDPGIVDKTQLSFLFCNRSDRHVLLKGLFDDLAKKYPERFRMYYTCDSVIDKNWKHHIGHIDTKMIAETMPAPKEEGTIVMICGPDNLLNHVSGTNLALLDTMSGGKGIQPMAPEIANMAVLGGLLGEMGYGFEQVYRF